MQNAQQQRVTSQRLGIGKRYARALPHGRLVLVTCWYVVRSLSLSGKQFGHSKLVVDSVLHQTVHKSSRGDDVLVILTTVTSMLSHEMLNM